ncbi:MAG: CpsB/CapC family capsule biosynthesis tyrosine phosphatase [Sulfurimonas sp.]|nr:CpsB/CapC family capsule biosynthesis tyrosine phosphatase [Sulfurimonas sp.]
MQTLFNKFFSKKNKQTLPYCVDIHSHLIPGIDDGSKTIKESIALIKQLKSFGFKKLITTPHIMEHKYPNSPSIILAGLDNLREELKSQNINIEVDAASEYYLDEYFLKHLQKKDLLTFGDNYILFEMSYSLKPINLEQIINDIKTAGYKPVLAHPERYLFMHKDFDIYKKLKKEGVFFQVNLNSFSGYYSKPVQKIAEKIMQEGWIDFIGSDTHKMSHLESFSKNINSTVLEKIFKKNKILNDTLI